MTHTKHGDEQRSNPLRIVVWGNTIVLTGFFIILWLTSAQLFRKAAKEPSGA